MLEVTRSFKTSDRSQARLLAAVYGQRVMELFMAVENGDFSRDDARDLVRDLFQDLASEVQDGFWPSSDCPQLEIIEQQGMAWERIEELRSSLQFRTFDGTTTSLASSAASARGIKLDKLPIQRRLDILEGTARALIEQQELYLRRIHDRLGLAEPIDPLFILRTANTRSHAHELSPPAVGLSLGQAIESYLATGTKKWTAKTLASRVSRLRDMEEHLGGNRLVSSISPHDIRDFRNAICRLRKISHFKKAGTFSERQTENPAHRIQSKTAGLIFETCKAFFRWCFADEGMIPSNPAQNVKVEITKQPKGKKSRRPFTTEELGTLFSAPLFTGCKSVHRRFEPGSNVIRDDYFWLPILGFYTGARMGELVQLHCDDLQLTGPHPSLAITEADGGVAGTQDAKHVKSEAGIRIVPLHPDLLELGFKNFVDERSKHKMKSKRLFRRIAYGSDGQASTVYSKWFARFLDKIGLSDPALVFHSFRHNAEDAFRDALLPTYVIDRIIGHSDGATSAGYGDGISSEVAHEAVSAMKLKLRLPSFWAK